jgi:hypothetical protein
MGRSWKVIEMGNVNEMKLVNVEKNVWNVNDGRKALDGENGVPFIGRDGIDCIILFLFFHFIIFSILPTRDDRRGGSTMDEAHAVMMSKRMDG